MSAGLRHAPSPATQVVTPIDRLIGTAYQIHRKNIFDQSVRRRHGRRTTAESIAAEEEREQMLTVGDRIPEFRLQAVVSLDSGKEFREITHESFAGKWKVIFLWPMDFTFICPTEV